MTNFLPKLILKLPNIIQETAIDSLKVFTGVTQEQLTKAVDAAVQSTTDAINGDMGMLWMLLSGILVFFMQAGFTLVESGMTRSKNAVNIAMKNLLDICVGSLTYWLVGYSLMYGDTTNGWFFWSGLFQGEGADLFFQTMFVCATVSIVSGAVAERIKIWPFFAFAVIMSGFIYPISMGWQWGGGWLSTAGFSDFAGSTLVHACGGAAALAGVIVLGAREGRFTKKGEKKAIVPFAASSIPLVTLGTFFLWFGWFGFNGFSQLAMGTFDDVTAITKIAVNTHLAGAAGVVTGAVVTRLLDSKTDVVMMLNGALAGLVAITAEPLTPTPGMALVIGSIGSLIMYFGTKFLERMGLDDVVGAIPVHMFAGIFGTLIVPLTNADTSFGSQFTGVIAVCSFSFILSFIIFKTLKATVGLRISKEAEKLGTYVAEIGV